MSYLLLACHSSESWNLLPLSKRHPAESRIKSFHEEGVTSKAVLAPGLRWGDNKEVEIP